MRHYSPLLPIHRALQRSERQPTPSSLYYQRQSSHYLFNLPSVFTAFKLHRHPPSHTAFIHSLDASKPSQHFLIHSTHANSLFTPALLPLPRSHGVTTISKNILSQNIHSSSLFTSHTLCLCLVQCRRHNYSLTQTLYRVYKLSIIAQHSFQRSARHIQYIPFSLCTTSLSHSPSAADCHTKSSKQPTSQL